MGQSAYTVVARLSPAQTRRRHVFRNSFFWSIFVLGVCLLNILLQNPNAVVATIVLLMILLLVAFAMGARVGILLALIIYSPFSLRLNLSDNFALSSDLLLFDLFAFLILVRSYGFRRPRFRVGVLNSTFLLFALVVTLMSALSTDIGLTARKLFYLLHYVLIFVLTVYVLRNEEDVVDAVKAFITVATVISFSALALFIAQFTPGFDIWQFRAWVPLNITWLLQGWDAAISATTNNNWIVPIGETAFFRTFFPFINPMALATYLLLAYPILLSCVVHYPHLPRPWFWRASLIVVTAAIILSFARSTWVGLLLASILVMVGPKGATTRILTMPFHWKLPKWLLLSLLLFLGLVILIAAVPELRERFISIGDLSNESNLDRFGTWATAWHFFSKQPLLGVGLGVFTETNYAHNAYLEFAVETGLVGVLLFAGIFAGSFFETVTIRNKTSNRLLYCFSIGWMASLASLAVHFFFDNEFFFPQNGIAIVLVLAIIKAAQVSQQRMGNAHRY